MKKTILGLILLVAVISVFLVKDRGSEMSGPIKIGVIGPYSGFLADFGEEVRRGVLTTQKDNIEFVFEDDECEPAPAVSAFKKLTDLNNVQYIIGPLCGSPQ